MQPQSSSPNDPQSAVPPIASHPPEIILVVDDETPQRHSIETFLREKGYSVVTAASASQALAWLENHVCALVLAKLVLPDDDRPGLLRAIASHYPQVAVSLMLPPASAKDALELLRQGAVDCLLGLVADDELLLAVERGLKVHRLRREQAELRQAWQEQQQALAESRQREAQLETLLRVGQAFNRAIDLEETILTINHHALTVSQVDVCHAFLPHREGSENTLPSPPVPDETFADFVEALAQQVIATGQPVQIPPAAPPAEKQNLLPAWLALPLSTGEKVLGVLCLGHRQAEAFTPAVRQTLSALADQAALALEKALLFQDLSTAYVDLSKSREEILDNRNILQALFDGFTDGLYVVDRNLTILAVNRAEAARLAKSVAQIEGKTCAELGWAETAPELLDAILDLFGRGQPLQWIPPETNSAHIFNDREIFLYPVRNPQQEIVHVIVFAQDVSERKRLQASLFQSANLAALGQLATSVAHEINNPLTVAVANSQLMLMETTEEHKQRDIVEAIYEAGKRIQRIIGNLVEFSNQETYLFSQIDLVENIEGALALVAHPLQREDIAIVKTFDYQPSLIASTSHLKMVWMNLLLNARDAIVASQRSGEINIHVAQDGQNSERVIVSIRDNGMGIPTDDHEQLFRPFFTTKPPGQALGLGLFTVHAIIERHNGQIMVESKEGQGATFTVILPLKLMPHPPPLPV